MSTITDRIMALPNPMPGTVRLDAVLEIVKNAVPVEIDEGMYPDASAKADGEEGEILAILSTAYHLLADKAAEFAARQIREQIEEELGISLISDAEFFAQSKDSSDPKAIKSYRNLAVRNPDRVEEIGIVFDNLITESIIRATRGAAQAFFGAPHGEAL